MKSPLGVQNRCSRALMKILRIPQDRGLSICQQIWRPYDHVSHNSGDILILEQWLNWSLVWFRWWCSGGCTTVVYLTTFVLTKVNYYTIQISGARWVQWQWSYSCGTVVARVEGVVWSLQCTLESRVLTKKLANQGRPLANKKVYHSTSRLLLIRIV